MIEKHRILYLISLLALTNAIIQGPLGHCLGTCQQCDLYALTRCKGNQPCQEGFYQNQTNSQCQLYSSLQSQEISQRPTLLTAPMISGWGAEAKVSQCQYPSLGSKQVIDVLGLFTNVFAIEKDYILDGHIQQLEYSFNLVRNEWLPFMDFLMIEVMADGKSIDTLQISHTRRISVSSRDVNVTCQNNDAFLERYSIKINQKINAKKIKILFTSFLFQGFWGITNMKLITGCFGFTTLDQNQKCSACASDSYLQPSTRTCSKCPELCKSCVDSSQCSECLWGELKNGQCLPLSTFKTQQIALTGLKTCGAYSMMQPSGTSLALPPISNINNDIYEQIVISLQIFYDSQVKPKIHPEVILSLRGQTIATANIIPSGAQEQCNLFPSKRMQRYQLVTKPIQNADITLNLVVQIKGVQQFAVGKAQIYSVQKVQPQPQNTPGLPPTSSLDIVKNQDQFRVQANNQTAPNQILHQDSDGNAYTEESAYATTAEGYLQVSVFGVPILQGQLRLEISPISPNDYHLVGSYYREGNLILVINITKSFKNGAVTIKEVSAVRRLVAGQTFLVATVDIPRFDAYSPKQIEIVSNFGAIFSVIAWIGIISMFLAVLSGYGIVVEEHIITCQLLYLHIYIGYDLLPLSFREAVANLRLAGFLHFIPEKMVNSEWALKPEAMYWLSPEYFNIFHALFPIFASLLIYTCWYMFLLGVKKCCLPQGIPDESRSTLHKLADNIVCRPINYADSIWRYQFISILAICTIQFIASQNQSQPAPLALAVIILVLTTIWLLFSELHIRNQYYENQYCDFIYLFDDRYFSKIPLHSLPSRHHRLGYPLMRVAKSLAFVLATMLIEIPILAIVSLICIHGFQLFYVIYNQIYSDQRMLKIKAVESSGILLVQFFMLAVRFMYGAVSSDFFLGWGYVMSLLTLTTIGVTVFRAIFIIYLKYVQSKGVSFQEVQIDQKKLQTQRSSRTQRQV